MPTAVTTASVLAFLNLSSDKLNNIGKIVSAWLDQMQRMSELSVVMIYQASQISFVE